MPDTRILAPGTFCWCELGAVDVKEAKRFYGGLFGWATTDGSPEAGGYGMIRLADRDVGGMYQLSEEMKAQGIPAHWLAYVKVASADEAATKAASLGGKVAMGPMDVMTAGRMAVIQDPTGGTFAVWEPRDHPGAGAMGESNSPCWFELISTDKNEAGAFYAALFGWKLESFLGAMDYTMFKNGEASVGGLMQRTEEMGDVPSHWLIYFAVDDCDGSAAQVTKLGGCVAAGPMDIPEVGRFAVVADPGGAMFAIIRLSAPGDV